MTQQRYIGEVWKEKDPFVRTKPWYVQGPNARCAFKTQRVANEFAKAILHFERQRPENSDPMQTLADICNTGVQGATLEDIMGGLEFDGEH